MINRTWIDRKWISLVAGQLKRFRWVDNNVANFRCPVCGDSDKDGRKARGYIYQKGQKFLFTCHNSCGTMSFDNFVKRAFPHQYDDYKLDIFKEQKSEHPDLTKQAEDVAQSVKKPELKTSVEFGYPILDLPETHPAREYCDARLIPQKKQEDIFYTGNFKKTVLQIANRNRYVRLPEDARILFPFRTKSGKIFGVQGRTFGNSKMGRYITIKIDDSIPKIFGMDKVDFEKPVLVVEGPIDSMFLPNCIALAGADIGDSIRYLGDAKYYMIFDNEPRSKDTVKRMGKAINKGYNVVFWPRWVKSKDVNDMIINKELTVKDILRIVSQNSLKGAKALAQLQAWKKTREPISNFLQA